MACKLYARCGSLDVYLGQFKDQDRASKHWQLVKERLESFYGTDIKPVFVQQGKGKGK